MTGKAQKESPSPVIVAPPVGVGAALAARRGITVVDATVPGDVTALAQQSAVWLVEPPLHTSTSDWCAFLAFLEISLAALAQKGRCARVVLLSSAAVYGEALRQPVMTVDPLAPVCPLGVRAAQAEAPVLAALRRGVLAGAVLRLGEITGHGAPPWAWARRVLAGEGPLPLPAPETPVSLLASQAALSLVDRLLFPPDGPAPAPALVYQAGGPLRPLSLVVARWRERPHASLTREPLFNHPDACLPLTLTQQLDMAGAQAHLGLGRADATGA